jgi:hypothetical protein
MMTLLIKKIIIRIISIILLNCGTKTKIKAGTKDNIPINPIRERYFDISPETSVEKKTLPNNRKIKRRTNIKNPNNIPNPMK